MGAKGMWRASVLSMIPKCRSDQESACNVLEWETRFTLGLNTAKNNDYIKKCLKQKLFGMKFPKKTQ